MNRSTPDRALVAAGCLGGLALTALVALAPEPVTAAPLPSPQVVPGGGIALIDQVNSVFRLEASTLIELDVEAEPGEAFELVVPVEGQDWTVSVWPHSIRAEGFTVYHQVEGGELIEVEAGPVRTLRGTVLEAPGSRVSGSLLADGVHLSLNIEGVGHYWTQPLVNTIPGTAPGDYVLYRHDDVIPSEGLCATAPAAFNDAANATEWAASHSGGGGGGIAGDECNAVTELACDADFPYFQDWGTETEARVESVIGQVNSQYESQTLITHQITAIIVRTSSAADPYNSTNPSTLLNQFRNHWLQNHTDVPRDVAHLFTGRNLNGGVIGIAFTIGGICTTSAYCLSESDCCSPNFPCATDLSAHELGHLWGAFHCGCPANTMNSFITCANNFSAGSINSIVNHRNSRTCLDDDCGPMNDECETAIVMNAGPGHFSSLNANNSTPTDSCAGTAILADVWFTYTATCTGSLSVATCNSQFDTVIAIYDVVCPGPSDEAIACNSDSCADQAEVTLTVVEGVEYAIRIGGEGAEQGEGSMFLSIECGLDCPGDIDGSGQVDVTDLTTLILAWGSDDPDADLDGSGEVDVTDLTLLILSWGPCL